LKIAVTVLLLFLISFLSGGYYFAFYLNRIEARTKVLDEINRGELPKPLQSFILTQNQLEKMEVDENELMVDGKWYDIVKTEHCDGYIIAFCIADEKETDLIASLNSFYDDLPIRNDNSLPQQLIHLLESSFEKETELASKFLSSSMELMERQVSIPLSAIAARPLYPPPDFAA